jgi:transcriptional regulator with XRE-family HTH domain
MAPGHAQPTTNVPTWTLGDRLAKSLDHAGVSVADMAEHLGVSRNTVGNYTSGRTEPRKVVVMAWALRCGVPLEWLTTGELDLTEDDDRDPHEAMNDRRSRRRTPSERPTSRSRWMVLAPAQAA